MYQSIKKHLNLANVKLVETVANADKKLIFELKTIGESRYYHDLLQKLLEVITTPHKEQIINEFDDTYQTIKNIYDSKEKIVSDSSNTETTGTRLVLNKILKKN